MSDKYILRSGAIDAIKRNSGTLYTREAEFLLRKVILLLKNAPAADVSAVVHGQWVTHYRSGTPVAKGYVSTCCDMWNNRKSDYCPSCGAKMDGGCENA